MDSERDQMLVKLPDNCSLTQIFWRSKKLPEWKVLKIFMNFYKQAPQCNGNLPIFNFSWIMSVVQPLFPSHFTVSTEYNTIQ